MLYIVGCMPWWIFLFKTQKPQVWLLIICSLSQLLPLWVWLKWTMFEKDPPSCIWTVYDVNYHFPSARRVVWKDSWYLVSRGWCWNPPTAKPMLLVDVHNVTLISCAGSANTTPGPGPSLYNLLCRDGVGWIALWQRAANWRVGSRVNKTHYSMCKMQCRVSIINALLCCSFPNNFVLSIISWLLEK